MTRNKHETDGHDYERVLPGHECPRCGEDDMDALVWIDDECVRCIQCGHIYQPGRWEHE